MTKLKLPRKSTNIDMTAMCDVAFLLLTFFMLATKFKPDDPVEIKIPESVSAKVIPDKDVLTLSFDKDGKIYLQMDNPIYKQNVIENISNDMGLGLNATQVKTFVNSASLGVPFAKLSSFLALDPDVSKKVLQDGIPVDSTNNELDTWVRYILSSYTGHKLNIIVKGDNNANYKNFKNVVDALKKNDQFKFELITSPEDAPVGTALWTKRNGKQNNI